MALNNYYDLYLRRAKILLVSVFSTLLILYLFQTIGFDHLRKLILIESSCKDKNGNC